MRLCINIQIPLAPRVSLVVDPSGLFRKRQPVEEMQSLFFLENVIHEAICVSVFHFLIVY